MTASTPPLTTRRAWKALEAPLADHWLPYVHGKTSREKAARELLIAIRALIDWWIERLEREPEMPVEVQDIPIE